MRSHLVQSPSLACHFGDLEGALPSTACPRADLPSYHTPGHTSHFPSQAPTPPECPALDGCPLNCLGRDQYLKSIDPT